jgi:hypothetical protein
MAFINFQPKDYFNTKLWTGTGAENAISSVGFQPDFTWIKRREVNSHRLFDAVRGATKFIESDSTAAEVTDAQELKSFDSDGFTLGTATKVNASAGTYASWNWRASNTTAVSNTDGDITSTVSASTTSGFSIVKYTGTGANATVGHGLGVAPKIVLVKDLSASASWRMFTEMTGNQSQLALDQTSAADSGNTTMWNSTSPTNTTFSIGTHPNVNTSSNNYIAYCFSPVRGFSSMGSYIGNGSADGSFIYTNGMKPSWLMIKRTDLADSWFMYDNKRSSFNVVDDYLIANGSGAEVSTSAVNLDFLSNGFKIRNTDGGHNNSGGTYIYIAFAESPIVSSNGVPATAR